MDTGTQIQSSVQGSSTSRGRKRKPTSSTKDAVKATKQQRKWTSEEDRLILDYLLDTIKLGFTIEKPNAPIYYGRLITEKALSNCTPFLVKNKVRNYITKYKEALKWRDETGQGVRESEGDIKFEEAMKLRYPYFNDFQEIWGSKVNIHVPYVSSSQQIGVPVVQEVVDGAGPITINIADASFDFSPEEDQNLLEEPVLNSGTSVATASNRMLKQPKLRVDSQSTKQLTKTAKQAYVEATKIREATHQEKLKIQKEQLELERTKVESAAQLDREKFEFDKSIREQEMEYKNSELSVRKLEVESKRECRLKELAVEELKLKLELEKYNNSKF